MSTELWNTWHQTGGPKYPHEKVVQFCFRSFPPDKRRGTRALDLGCGSGVNTVFLAAESFTVTGTDFSPVGVDNTRRKLQALGLSAELRVEGADVLDFPDASFDLVICAGVYCAAGAPVAEASVRRLRRVLAPGAKGMFLFASDRDHRVHGENPGRLHGYSQAEVQRLFDAGFANVWLDRYITTYQGGKLEENHWLVTIEQ